MFDHNFQQKMLRFQIIKRINCSSRLDTFKIFPIDKSWWSMQSMHPNQCNGKFYGIKGDNLDEKNK